MKTTPYKNTSLTDSFYLEVSEGHQLNVEIFGNPNGIPVVFLHGGPGAQIGEKARWFFNPDKYQVILFDQRGTGKSKPFLSLTNNTPFASVKDIETLRIKLGIEKWIVFGGSYGTTLGLLYAILHPKRVMHMILRGIFLGRKEDINWLFQFGASNFYPEEFERFKNFIPNEKQDDLVQAYYEIMIGHNQELAHKACKSWADWENSILRIVNEPVKPEIEKTDLTAGLLEAHYFAHHMFWPEDNYLLNHAEKLQEIPISVFHGRFDIDCRPMGAYELKKACPHVELNIVQKGSHFPYDSPLFDLLLQKMEELADKY